MSSQKYPEQSKPHPAFCVHKVLDKGFIRLVDCLPNPCDPYSISADDAIAQMARVSYGGDTEKKRDNIGLINYLMENRHTSPFEGVVLKFHIKMPIFIERQWSRHRTASQNQLSARYSVLPADFYIPEPSRCQGQDFNMKQGSSGVLGDNKKIVEYIHTESNSSYSRYQDLLDMGLARELSRSVLPVNIYTEMYWMMNLHNLLHFTGLRISSHAQYEIRVYAEKIKDIIGLVAPVSLDAWENHIEKSISISRDDVEILKGLIKTDAVSARNKISQLGWSKRKTDGFLSKLNQIS